MSWDRGDCAKAAPLEKLAGKEEEAQGLDCHSSVSRSAPSVVLLPMAGWTSYRRLLKRK
jgi:hypothetical protein